MPMFARRSARADDSKAKLRLRDLDDREREWVAAHVDLIIEAGVDVDDAARIRTYYERSAAAWRRINPPERDDPRVTVNAIGAAFGEHLVRRMRLRWMLAEDDEGIELAVYDLRTGTIVYPVLLTAERWMAEAPGDFLAETADLVAAKVPAANRKRHE